jgi:hypothetical protein
MAFLPIAALEQRPHDPESLSVKGLVTLIWPFSASSRKFAFLLAEADFRLRHQKGQIRIQLSGAAALELARSRIEIGDQIELRLRGAKWVEREGGVVSTPGRSVGFELRFSNELHMEVFVLGDSSNCC